MNQDESDGVRSSKAIHGCRRTLGAYYSCVGRFGLNDLERLAVRRTRRCLRLHSRRGGRDAVSVSHRTVRFVVRRMAGGLRPSGGLGVIGSRGRAVLASQSCAPRRMRHVARRRARGRTLSAQVYRRTNLETRRLLALHRSKRIAPSLERVRRGGFDRLSGPAEACAISKGNNLVERIRVPACLSSGLRRQQLRAPIRIVSQGVGCRSRCSVTNNRGFSSTFDGTDRQDLNCSGKTRKLERDCTRSECRRVTGCFVQSSIVQVVSRRLKRFEPRVAGICLQ